MKSILTAIESNARQALEAAFGSFSLDAELLRADVTVSTQPQFGHYQCNSALKLSRALKMPPRQVAEKIVAHFKSDGIASLEIAGPGFINITLTPSFIATQLRQVEGDPRLGIPLPEKPLRIVVDFSSPNIAKELHVGHLRSTIIGDALARLFEFLGHDVLRLNHIGDWGTQFGMLIAHMRSVAPDALAGRAKIDLVELMRLYQASKKRFDEDPEFKKQAQLQVVRLQAGDTESKSAWETICEISRRAFQEIYALLDVRLTERGESFYNADLPLVVRDLGEKGLLTLSEGAHCLFLEGFAGQDGLPLPMIVQKSDGGYNYDTTDMAALRHRTRVEHADRIIYVTDAGQSLHFAMLFKAAEKAGYLDPSQVRVDHVPFGVVLGPDGKKFKTRSGQTEKLVDLLLEAVTRAKAVMQERLPDLSEEELERAARILGIDAVKYADLSSNRIKDYVFSYDRMLSFEGNTAAFLLYAYVRIQSIKRKVGKEIEALIAGPAAVSLEHPVEEALALHVCQFGDVLRVMSDELLPNRLCDYLYELSEKFHAFFRDCRVEGSSLEESRLLLCEAVARTLARGLDILGLKILDRM
jgi:arginyl-tRNA synthetase